MSHDGFSHAKTLRRIEYLAVAVVFLLSICAISACQSEESRLKIGVHTDIVGMSNMDADTGEYSGFEIDVARAVAKQMGFQDDHIDFIGVSGNTRETMLDAGYIDMVVACYSVTEERKAKYNLSVPYATASVMMMVRKDSGFGSVADMDGATIAVREGSTTVEAIVSYSESLNTKVFTSEYETFAQAADALKGGIVDGFCTDDTMLKGYLDDNTMLLGDSFSPQEYAIASCKNDTELASHIDQALVTMQGNGTLQELQQKWGR